jgi:hypothetical protein
MCINRRMACISILFISAAAFHFAAAQNTEDHPGAIGYTDTPLLPGGKWHVHDSNRPQPPAVETGASCLQEKPAPPPSDAVVLFDGSGLESWRTADGKIPAWTVADGVLRVPVRETPNGGDIYTREEFGDCQLHVEWATPNPPAGDVMNRGNSGIYFFGVYELQVFDSFRGGIYADGQAAAIYGQYPPLVNASRRPGDWQWFDVIFTAPRFKNASLETPAYLTAFHNGVVVQNHVALLGATGHRILPKYTVHGPRGPLVLQAHGNPVRYRNIWIRQLAGSVP